MVASKIPTAGEWMSEIRLTLRREDSITDAISKLARLGVAVGVVVDDTGRLIGLLTEKDCLRLIARAAYDDAAQNGTVGDYMSEVVSVLEPGMDLFRTAEVFLGCNFPTLPVVEGGKVVGRLRRQDMLECMDKFLALREQEKEELRRQIEQGGNRPRSIEAMQQTAAKSTPDRLAKLFSRNR